MEKTEGKKETPTRTVFLHSPVYRPLRKRELLRYIKRSSQLKGEEHEANGLSVDKVAGLFSWKWGISVKVIEEYIREMQVIGAIVRNGDRIRVTEIGRQLLSEGV